MGFKKSLLTRMPPLIDTVVVVLYKIFPKVDYLTPVAVFSTIIFGSVFSYCDNLMEVWKDSIKFDMMVVY